MEHFDPPFLEVEVVSGDAANGEREPIAFVVGRRCVVVRRVLDRWLGAGYRYFKLLDEEGATYILRHDEGRGVWEMTFFERMSPIAAGAIQVAES